MPLRDIPIQRKLTMVLMLTCGAVLLVTCLAFVIYEVITIRRGMVQSFTVRAQMVADNASAALLFADENDAVEVLGSFKNDPRMMSACIYDNDQQIFARYPTNAPPESFPTTPLSSGHYYGRDHLGVFFPITHENRVLGTVFLKANLTALTDRYRAFTLLALVILVGSLLMAYFICKKLQAQISGPILALSQMARAVSEQHDYSVRAAPQGKDELGSLTDSFNQMLERIQQQNHALSESEARLRAVLNSALSAVVVMDTEGRIADWNARAEIMFGRSRAEAIGRDLGELVIPQRYREAHRRGMERFLKTGHGAVLNQLLEMPALRRDGHEFPVELSISPLKNGEVITFCGFITDITERKQAIKQSAAFAKLGQRLSAAASVDSAARTIAEVADELLGFDAGSLDLYDPEKDLIYPVLNVDTVEGKRTDVAPSYAGQPPSTLARQVIGEGAKLILRQPPYEFASGGVPFGNTGRPSASLMYVPIRRGDKILGLLSIQSYTPNAYDDNALQLLQTLADQCSGALERIRAEETVRELNEQLERRVVDRTAQLEAVNQELEAFSYSVSHDLRAPLRHVSGFAEMLRQETGDNLSETGKKFLRLMADAAKRMGVLIDDLLVFSRMGRTSLRRTLVDMNELVAEVRQEMAADFENRDIQWTIVPMPELSVDRPMFKQVWINLISNAVKYTRQKERAIIQMRCAKNDAGQWVFSVQDNGAGFDMQYADKLFGVFQRLHHAEEFEGTGIGLANVRRIIQRHGGQTWAEGKVGEGATFYFSVTSTEDKRHETQTHSARRG
jgi:PAS domain S-box-containing protein